jgi:hypothetical protein
MHHAEVHLTESDWLNEAASDEELRLYSAEDILRIAEIAGVKRPPDLTVPEYKFLAKIGRLHTFLNRRGAAFLGWKVLTRPSASDRESRKKPVKFLRRIERISGELLKLIGDAEKPLIQRLYDLQNYYAESEIQYSYKNFSSYGYNDFELEETFQKIAALRSAVRVGLIEAQPKGTPGAPRLGDLEYFVLGLAIEYQRLTGNRFTFMRVKAKGRQYEPVTPGHMFVCAAINHIASYLENPVPSKSIATAAERAVRHLRRLKPQSEKSTRQTE